MDLARSLSQIFVTKKKDRAQSIPGNQVWGENSGVPEATISPPRAKLKTMHIAAISSQHDRFESYQGVMVFLKNGFWSSCICVSGRWFWVHVWFLLEPQYVVNFA